MQKYIWMQLFRFPYSRCMHRPHNFIRLAMWEFGFLCIWHVLFVVLKKVCKRMQKKEDFQLSNFEGVGRGGGEATPEAFGAVIKHANCIRANWQVTEVFATCTQSKLRGRENQSNAFNANGELCLSEINFGITPLPPFPLPLPPPTTQSINRKSLQITQQILALEGATKCGQFAYKYPGYAISENLRSGGYHLHPRGFDQQTGKCSLPVGYGVCFPSLLFEG